MGIEIRHGRLVGEVVLDAQGNIIVNIDDEEARDYIKNLFEHPVTIFKPFRNPGIPGRVTEERMVATDDEVFSASKKYRETRRICT